MFNELQKRSMKKVTKLALISAGALLLILIIFGSSFLKLIQGPVDLYSLSKDELLGTYVEGDINVIIDNFASYSEQDNSGKKRNRKNYYIIPICDEELIAISVYSNDFSLANQICNDTYDYIFGKRGELTKSIHIKGTINKLKGDVSDYYFEWFEQSGFMGDASLEEIEKYALPYVLEANTIGIFEVSYIYIALLVCSYFAIYMLIILVKGFTGAYLSQIKRFIKENESTISVDTIELDYEKAVAIDSVKIGNQFTFCFLGSKPFILRNDDIIWAYLKRTTHKTYGIKTGVSTALILRTTNKKIRAIDMTSEENVSSALKIYSENNPNIILGYSEELFKCYRKDFEKFLNMSRQQKAAAANRNVYVEKESAESGMEKVTLLKSGDNKIHVIKVIREFLGCGLKEAKDLVDNTPSVIKENISMKDALAIKAELEGLDATVEINKV